MLGLEGRNSRDVGHAANVHAHHHADVALLAPRFCDQVGTTLKTLERATPWANRAELFIRLLKEAVRKDMRESNSPMVLWDYAIERRALIHNAVTRPLFQAQGKYRMNALLVIRVTFLMSVMLAGMNGFIIVILVPSLKIRRI